MAVIKNFQRMIQSIRKSCFGSIIKGSSNFWIGSTANGMQEKLYLQTYRVDGFAFVLKQDAGNGAAVIVVQLFGAG